MSFFVPHFPLHIEQKIDEITGYKDITISYDQWINNERELLAEYGIKEDFQAGGYVVDSEEAYTFFLLRFS
jgi:hypothetical protein